MSSGPNPFLGRGRGEPVEKPKPEVRRARWRDPSRYSPHQNKSECARRLRQLHRTCPAERLAGPCTCPDTYHVVKAAQS